ncbi:hypothetical protein [Pseudomonas sp. FP1740]|uniref:hypothetical protein n=1 Tax=Pseudomonas sp. FP1740 TaxID=2954078 RepID=UPI002733FD55|nr:hypothetical protein [Pseudomonas sp. FP1740]WLG45218.1 hypothetical protein PSH69_00890 [Pseudomonas sp. FP1740]
MFGLTEQLPLIKNHETVLSFSRPILIALEVISFRIIPLPAYSEEKPYASRRLQEISLHDTLLPSLPIQRPGLETRRHQGATAPHHDCRRFFSPAILCYGGCAWDVF